MLHVSEPLRMLFLPTDEGKYPVAVAISVPKRLFGRSIDRNLLKRRMREAYRISKPAFYEALNQCGIHLNLMVIYRSREIYSFRQILDSMQKGLAAISSRVAEMEIDSGP